MSEDDMIDAKDGTGSPENCKLRSRKDLKRQSTIKHKQALPLTKPNPNPTQHAAAQNATIAIGKTSAAAPVAEKDNPYTYYVADSTSIKRMRDKDWNEIGTGRPGSPLNSTTVNSYENTSVYSRFITNNSECRQSPQQRRRNQYSPPNSPCNSIAEKSRASLDQISRLQQQTQLTNFSLSPQQLRGGEHDFQRNVKKTTKQLNISNHQEQDTGGRSLDPRLEETDLANSRETSSGLLHPSEGHHPSEGSFSTQHCNHLQDNNSLFSMNNGNAPFLLPQQQHQLQFPQYQPPISQFANNMQQQNNMVLPMMMTSQFQQQPMTSQSQFVPIPVQQYTSQLLSSSVEITKLQQQQREHLQQYQQQQQNMLLKQQLVVQEKLFLQHLAMDAGMNHSILNNNIPLQPFQSLSRSQVSGVRQDTHTEGYGGDNGLYLSPHLPQLHSSFLSDQYSFEDHTQTNQNIKIRSARQGAASAKNSAKKKEKHAELKQKLLNDLDFQETIRNRPFICLGRPKDAFRLTEFMCFLRAECIEVFRASFTDVDARKFSKKVLECQVGIRCRFCTEIPFSSRVGRSSSYPSSLDRIYQSVTMMIRDHFPMCPLMLPEVRTKYDYYRNSKQQQVVKRKHGEVRSYWVDSAKELGMFDSKNDEQAAMIQMLKEMMEK